MMNIMDAKTRTTLIIGIVAIIGLTGTAAFYGDQLSAGLFAVRDVIGRSFR